MDAGNAPNLTLPLATPPSAHRLAERLEQGDVHVLDAAATNGLPSDDDRSFLRSQELGHGKEIVFEPTSDRLTGFRVRSPEETERLRAIFEASQTRAAAWIRDALPEYGDAIEPFRTCFHVAEEATRCLRVTSRNDLLHVDALHHSRGRRLLRLFVNLNPIDPRIWASSETLAKVLPSELPKSGLLDFTPSRLSVRLGHEMLRLLRAEREVLDPYDNLMLEFTRSLKHSDEFQERSPRKIWRFQPGQAWLAFTDTLVHADLRGRWILDHLFLLPRSACVRPELAPAALLESLRSSRSRTAA
ncbi:MAG: Kdo hydroxylase family protein [Planctomycetota bacterium]